MTTFQMGAIVIFARTITVPSDIQVRIQLLFLHDDLHALHHMVEAATQLVLRHGNAETLGLTRWHAKN